MQQSDSIGHRADSLSIPRNPLIDGSVHHATAANVASMLEFIAGSEDVHGGLYLSLLTVTDAARHLAKALKPLEEPTP